ncbi:MAG: acyl carrier protein [Actinobacteria bacterium]|nr:acyl carrier protein [Actinomycetota bacterium]
MTQDIEQEIRAFIADELLDKADAGDVPRDMPLLGGFLDSFGLMVLINFVEERFEVTIANSDVTDDNFRSVEALAGYVRNKAKPTGG